jgi:hypothetical protein
MDETGFKGVIERLKAEGQLTRNTGTNSIKSIGVKADAITSLLKSIDKHISMQSLFMEVMIGELSILTSEIDEMIKDNARARAFESVKAKADTSEQTTKTEKTKRASVDDADKQAGSSLLDIFSLSGLTASVIGAAIGMMKGQLKAINFFSGGLFNKALSALNGKILGVVEDIGGAVTKGFKAIRNTVAAGLIAAAQILDFSKDSKFLGVINKISSVIGYVVKPFSEAAKMISGWIGAGEKVSGIFGKIGGFLGEFGSTVGKVSGIVGKLFYPITIIMTAFDTIKGILDGYAEGGILGALEGGITAFFNSLIFAPLDLIKDMTSWVVGMLGFENAAEALDSFSFQDIFGMLVGGIFDLGTAIVTGVIDEFKSMAAAMGDLWGWVGDTWESISTAISDKFSSFAEYLGSIPDRIWQYAQEMFIDVSAKLKKGFIMFGDWLASLPARIKLSALSTIREYDPTGLLVSEEDVTNAQAAVTNRSSDTAAKLAAVDVETATQKQALAEKYANSVSNAAATTSNNINAPTVNNNGGNTTNNTTSTTTIIQTSPHASVSAYMPQ